MKIYKIKNNMRTKSYVIFLAILVILNNGCNNRTVDPLKFVNPFIGTEGDNGQMYPGASYPFGLVQLSPETEGDSHVGYYFEDKFIEGFSHLRISGAGSQGKGGGILIKPGIGNFTNRITDFRERYIKSSEEASPGFYKVSLESGIKAELTVTRRVGFHRYTFPSDETGSRYVILDLSHSYVGMLDAKLNVVNDHEITGMIKSLHNKRGHYHKLYFALIADHPFDYFISWKGVNDTGNVALREGKDIGVWLKFPDDLQNVIQLKVGLSPVSEEEALMEARTEIKGWDFDSVRKSTASRWRKMLSRIEVPSGSDEFRTLLYTHLYHSYLNPVIASSTDGKYCPANLEDSVLYTQKTSKDFEYYSMWSLWDDFRKYSLISLLEPEIDNNIVVSLVDYYRNRITDPNDPRRLFWPVPNIRTEFAGAVILDSYLKGFTGFDMETAYKGMKEDFLLYNSSNVGSRLEKAYHAYLALEMAKILKKDKAEIEMLSEGAEAYKELWCAQQKDNQGNIRGFFTPDGKPVDDVEVIDKYADEANLWHYRWFVLHDVKGFAELRGGSAKLADDLEYFFDNNFYMHVNQPDIHAPYLFNLLGKPYLTQKWVRTLTTKEVTQLYHNHGFFDKPIVNRIYRADSKGYIETMDDDAGCMSSWFVMSAIGLYPFNPAEPFLQIGSPIFPEVILHLGNGKNFRIVAKNVSEENFYIRSSKLNGKEYNKPWIDYKDILKGGILEFEMSDKPVL